MDLKLYFQNIRTIEATIPGPHAVIVSLETSDGGRAGLFSEVTRDVAAKLVAQGKARLADEREAQEFKSATRDAHRHASEALSNEGSHFNALQAADMELLRSLLRRDQ